MSCSPEPIRFTYKSPEELLSKVALYYPTLYNHYGLQNAYFLARGSDAYTFFVDGKIFKFTQSRSHAKVSLTLVTQPQKHLVQTHSVFQVPDLSLWLIIEEKLQSLDAITYQRLRKHIEGMAIDITASKVVDCIIQDLETLKVHDWGLDCVHAHNLMRRPTDKNIVAMDFGYTRSALSEDFPVWR